MVQRRQGVWLHYPCGPFSAIQGEGYKSLPEAAKVEYVTQQGEKGPQAANVSNSSSVALASPHERRKKRSRPKAAPPLCVPETAVPDAMTRAGSYLRRGLGTVWPWCACLSRCSPRSGQSRMDQAGSSSRSWTELPANESYEEGDPGANEADPKLHHAHITASSLPRSCSQVGSAWTPVQLRTNRLRDCGTPLRSRTIAMLRQAARKGVVRDVVPCPMESKTGFRDRAVLQGSFRRDRNRSHVSLSSNLHPCSRRRHRSDASHVGQDKGDRALC